MAQRLVLIHTVAPLVDVFSGLCARLLPGVQVFHVLDEPLLERVRLRGGVGAGEIARLQAHARSAEQIGAEAALVTCSTLSPAVDRLRSKVPIFKIDEAMISQAVALGERIGVIATNPTTLEPTRNLLLAQAARLGRRVVVHPLLVEGAFSALMSGDGETHDGLVLQAIRRLAESVDVVVLAQASMARALERLPEAEWRVPVLASPQAALAQVRRQLENAAGERRSRRRPGGEAS